MKEDVSFTSMVSVLSRMSLKFSSIIEIAFEMSSSFSFSVLLFFAFLASASSWLSGSKHEQSMGKCLFCLLT